ncbi:hypothetical protein CPB86DRAFT_226351 [Serendipita vermifera]|nr:hypothetical protein CPB86DRAFT_226351 [Serendipita vermifera]
MESNATALPQTFPVLCQAEASLSTLTDGYPSFLSPIASGTFQPNQGGGQITLPGSTPTIPPITTVPAYPIIQPKPILGPQSTRCDSHHAIRRENIYSSLDPERQKLFEYIRDTDLVRCDLPEPNLGSLEANNILWYLDVFHNVTFSPDQIKKGRSLYTLLTDPAQYKCLMCGSTKTSAQRAVDCVRAHIGHRPFRCGGWELGCGICHPDKE